MPTNFSFSVDDLAHTSTAKATSATAMNPFQREQTKNLASDANGNPKPLQTTGSYAITNTFNPAAGASLLGASQMMMGPGQFFNQSANVASAINNTSAVAGLTSADLNKITSAVGTGSTTAAAGASGTASGTAVLPANANNAAKIQVVIAAAQSQLGVPYTWGAESPKTTTSPGGFDCSGLMEYCFAQGGVTLPRVAQAQYDSCKVTPQPATADILVGDMVFYGPDSTSIDHVALYQGLGRESDQVPQGQVCIEALNSSAPVGYWDILWPGPIVGVGRPLPLAATTTAAAAVVSDRAPNSDPANAATTAAATQEALSATTASGPLTDTSGAPTARIVPFAKWEQVPSSHFGGAMTSHKGLVLHVCDGDNDQFTNFSTTTYTAADGTTEGISSTWWVAKDGTLIQYVDADAVAHCQVAGNPDWNSVETEGYPTDKLTDAQVQTLAKLYVWGHQTYGWPLATTDDVNGTGFGWHGMGGADWGGHPDCPGDLRKAQRDTILYLANLVLNPTA